MRGGFRRSRQDKVPQPGAIDSFAEAIYPPRVYHYYALTSNPTAALSSAVIIPSIDDGVGELHGREAGTQGSATLGVDRKTPPLLRDFIGCFMDGKQYLADARAFAIVQSGSEPLNILHYQHLLMGGNPVDPDTKSTMEDKKCSNGNSVDSRQLRLYEEALGLPGELRCYSLMSARRDMSASTFDHLRIRPVKRKRIVKPMRRGAKVISITHTNSDNAQDGKRMRRDLGNGGDEEVMEAGAKLQQRRGDDDDCEEEGGGRYDKEDDEASLSFQVDDDDDGGDLDGPEGSGGEDDFF